MARLGYFLPLFLFFFSACEEKIYSKKFDYTTTLSCLALKGDNENVACILEDKIHVTPACEQYIYIESNYVESCNAYMTKSLGNDFDGYVRFSLFDKKKLLYKNQQDFKGKENIERIIENLVNDIKKNMPVSEGIFKK